MTNISITMKTIFKIMLSIMLLGVICINITSCSNEAYTPPPKDPSELNDEMQKQIKEDFIKAYPRTDRKYTQTIYIGDYGGRYNDYLVLMVYYNGGWTANIGEQKIAGCLFEYGYAGKMNFHFAYKDGAFIKLSEAYDQGLLSADDIKAIHYYYTHRN